MPWRIQDADGSQRGPFKKEEILHQIRLGLIESTALISKAKAAPWEPIVDHPDFAKALKGQPTPSPVSRQAPPPGYASPPVFAGYGTPLPSPKPPTIPDPSVHKGPPLKMVLGLAGFFSLVLVVVGGVTSWSQEQRRLRALRDGEELQRKVEQEEKAAQEAKERRRRQEEDLAWGAISKEGCQTPAHPDACAPVESFLSLYPESSHTVEGKQLLATAAPALAELKDEADWKHAQLDKCKAPKESSDCDLIRRYAEVHAGGKHAEEASKVLAISEPRVKLLLAQEQAKEEAERRIREAKEAAEERVRKAKEAQAAAEKAATESDNSEPHWGAVQHWGSGHYYKGGGKRRHRKK